MTTVSVIFLAVGFTVFLGFGLVHYQDGQQRSAIWLGLGAWICAGVGVATYALGQVAPAANAPTLQDIAIANQQRGYLRIEPFWMASGDEIVAVRYRYKMTGLTSVTIESGFMRMSIDEPSPEHTRTNPERFSKPLVAVTVDPPTTDLFYNITFPALTAEQRTAWSNGQLVIFLTGAIVYTDNFFPITRKHRKYFGWRWNGGRLGPDGSMFSLNGFVRNDEEDER